MYTLRLLMRLFINKFREYFVPLPPSPFIHGAGSSSRAELKSHANAYLRSEQVQDRALRIKTKSGQIA